MYKKSTILGASLLLLTMVGSNTNAALEKLQKNLGKKFKETALKLAKDAMKNDPEVIRVAMQNDMKKLKKLVEEIGDPDKERSATGDTALSAAALMGNLTMVNYLLEKGADPLMQGITGSSPLTAAIISGKLPVVKAIVEKIAEKGNVNDAIKKPYGSKGMSPLILAALLGENKIINYLIDKTSPF